ASSSFSTPTPMLVGRCSGVLVASFQTPCRSGSPHGVFGATYFFGAWPAAGTTKPTASTAASNAIDERTRLRMAVTSRPSRAERGKRHWHQTKALRGVSSGGVPWLDEFAEQELFG